MWSIETWLQGTNYNSLYLQYHFWIYTIIRLIEGSWRRVGRGSAKEKTFFLSRIGFRGVEFELAY